MTAWPTSTFARCCEFHDVHGKLATVTTVRPPARFGQIVIDGDRVREFTEKPQTGEGWINGGFFVLKRRRSTTSTATTRCGSASPWSASRRDGQLMAYRHEGFWQPMDTLREKRLLDDLWASGQAPWKMWT